MLLPVSLQREVVQKNPRSSMKHSAPPPLAICAACGGGRRHPSRRLVRPSWLHQAGAELPTLTLCDLQGMKGGVRERR